MAANDRNAVGSPSYGPHTGSGASYTHQIHASPHRTKNEPSDSSPIKADASRRSSSPPQASSSKAGNARDDTKEDKKSQKRPREQYIAASSAVSRLPPPLREHATPSHARHGSPLINAHCILRSPVRRKQKCDRRFPCNNCIKRRLPERCVPPASARASIGSGLATSPTPSESGTVHRNSISRTASDLNITTTPAAKRQRIDEDGWDDRKIDELARTTLEDRAAGTYPGAQRRLLSRTAPCPRRKAVRLRLGEESSSRAINDFGPNDQISRRSSYVPDDERDRPTRRRPSRRQRRLPSALPVVHPPQPHAQRLSHPVGRRPGHPRHPAVSRPSASATLTPTLPTTLGASAAPRGYAARPLPPFVAGVPSPSDVRMDAETLPVCRSGARHPHARLGPAHRSAAVVGHIPRLILGHQKGARPMRGRSGLASLDSCWAHGVLVRYLDVIRVTRASWHEIGSWIRDALDLGLHRDRQLVLACPRSRWRLDASSGRTSSTTIASGASSSAVRSPSPFTPPKCPRARILNPSALRARRISSRANRLTACLEAITHCFEEALPEPRAVGTYLARLLPRARSGRHDRRGLSTRCRPTLAPNWSELGQGQDRHEPRPGPSLLPFYRYLILGEVCFYRSLLHRPYLLRPASHGKHPFPESRRVCVEAALNDLRLRKEYARVLSKEQLAQSFGGAYALFNSAIVVGMALLIGSAWASASTRLISTNASDYLQNFITQLRRNFDAGNVDASAEREQMVIEVLVSRLEPFLPRDLAKRSRGELAAAKGSMRATMMQDPMRRSHAASQRVEQEKQAVDSLRLLSTSVPGTPTMSNNGAGQLPPSSMQSMPPSHHLAGSPTPMGGPGFDSTAGAMGSMAMGGGAGAAAAGMGPGATAIPSTHMAGSSRPRPWSRPTPRPARRAPAPRTRPSCRAPSSAALRQQARAWAVDLPHPPLALPCAMVTATT
ncbi:hypothetical protein L1887_54127 [Cichorium endivia]|nr:hypothetical protein L1887_54127 [Cichorium endivia]